MKPLVIVTSWSISIHGSGSWDGIYVPIKKCPICKQTLPEPKKDSTETVLIRED